MPLSVTAQRCPGPESRTPTRPGSSGDCTCSPTSNQPSNGANCFCVDQRTVHPGGFMLERLPPEMAACVLQLLALPDLLTLAQTCRAAREVVAVSSTSWLPALGEAHFNCVPQGVAENLRQSRPPLPGAALRHVALGLRAQQPAALWAPLSPGTRVPCTSSDYPQVLHLDGVVQRTLQIQFPRLPRGRYQLALSVRAAPGYQRGFVSFCASFRRAPAPMPCLTAFSAGDPPLSAANQEPSTLLSSNSDSLAEGAEVHGPMLVTSKSTLMSELRSWLLGSCRPTWRVLDRACIASAAMAAPAGIPFGLRKTSQRERVLLATTAMSRSLSSGPGAPFVDAPGPTPPQEAPHLASSVQHGPAPSYLRHPVAEAAEVADGASNEAAAAVQAPWVPTPLLAGANNGWGKVALGEVTLKRSCAAAFVVVLVQTARLPSTTAPGGVFVDHVSLQPVAGWRPATARASPLLRLGGKV